MFPFQEIFVDFFWEWIFKPQNKCGQQRSWSQLILVGVWEASWTLINDGGTNVTGWKPIEMFGLRTCRARCVKKTTKKNTDKKRLNLFRHMGSRDLWIDLDLSFLRWVMTCIEVNNFWTSRFWLQIHLFCPKWGLLSSDIWCWGYALELADAGVFWWKRGGLKKTALEVKRDLFHQISRGILWLGISTNLDHESCWNCWVDFPEVCVEFSEKRQSIILKFVFTRSQTLFSFAPSRIDRGLRARQCYLKGQSNQAFVHVWYFFFSYYTFWSRILNLNLTIFVSVGYGWKKVWEEDLTPIYISA